MRDTLRSACLSGLTLVLVAGSSLPARGADKPKSPPGEKPQPIAIAAVKHDGPVSFAKEIQPILSKKCLACHNNSKHESQLILESTAAILKGGESGPAVIAKNAAGSLLLQSASHQAEPIMPPADNDVGALAMTSEELGLVKLWIDQGAIADAAATSGPVQWQSLPPGINPIYSVAMTEDGTIGACGRANQIFLYHLPSGQTLTRLTDPALLKLGRAPGTSHLDLVHSLAFSPDGQTLASGGFREIKLWRRLPTAHKFDLAGLPEPATALVASRDGRLVATGHASGAIILWDGTSGAQKKALAGHTGAVTALEFFHNGEQLASASADKTVRVWKLADGSAVAQTELPVPLASLALASDDSQLAAAGADKTIYVWKLGSDEPRKIESAASPVTVLVGSPIEKLRVYSGHADGSIGLWNLENLQSVRQINHGAAVSALAVRGDGLQFASAGADNAIKLWKADSGKPWTGVTNQPIPPMTGDLRAQLVVEREERDVAKLTAKAASAKQAVTGAEALVKSSAEAIKTTATAKETTAKAAGEKAEAAKKPVEAKAAADKELEVALNEKNAAEQKATAAKEAAEKDAQNADLAKARDEARKSADEALAKFNAAEKKAKESDALASKAMQESQGAEAAKSAAEQAATGAVAANQKAIEAVPQAQAAEKTAADALVVGQAKLDAAKTAAKATASPIRALTYSPDQKTLASAGDDKLVHTWSTEFGAPIDVYSGHQAAVSAAAFVADGALISAAADKAAFAWNLNPVWSLERTIGNPDNNSMLDDRVLSLAFSPDGKLLASGGGEPTRSGELKLWNVADGKLVRAVSPAHSDTIFCVDFAREGNYIASAGADRMMKVFEVASGNLVHTFEGHTHHVLGVAWRADGKVLVSCGADNSVKMWDFATGEQTRAPLTLAKEVTAVRFVGLSTKILVAGGDKIPRLYETTTGAQDRTYSGPTDFVYSLSVSGDGKTAIGGGQDSTMRLWNIDASPPVREFPAPPADGASVAKQ